MVIVLADRKYIVAVTFPSGINLTIIMCLLSWFPLIFTLNSNVLKEPPSTGKIRKITNSQSVLSGLSMFVFASSLWANDFWSQNLVLCLPNLFLFEC